MADGISKEEMQDLFERFFGGAGAGGGKSLNFDTKNLAEFKKQLQESTEAMKKSLPVSKQLTDVLYGQRGSLVDITDELDKLDKEIAELNKTVKDSAREQEVFALTQARNEKALQAQINNSRVGLQNFTVGMAEVATTLIKGAFQFAKDIQGGASGVEAGTEAAATAARATGDTISNFGQLLGSLGPIIGTLLKSIPMIGPIIQGAGIALDIFGKKAADVGEAGAKFLGEELKKTVKSFKQVNEAGALFGGGMTELRKTATAAGLDVKQLSEVVKNNKDSLLLLGMGLAEGTKRIAGVSKELRNSELGIQLRKLGYEAEEQAGLAADLMANQRAAGIERVQSDRSIAEQTVRYGKDLKILADITGKDAKKAMEKARTESMKADIMARLSGEEALKFQAQLARMPEALHKGFIQYVSSGGEVITDVATNILAAEQPEVMKVMQQGYANIKDSNKSAADVATEASKSAARLGEAERARARGGDAVINMANTLGTNVSGAISATADLTNQIILQTQATEKAVDAANKNAELAAANTKPLDASIANLEESTQKLKAAMGDQLLGPITKFASTMAAGVDTVEERLKKMGLDPESTREKGFNEKFGEAAGGAGGGIAAGAFAGGLVGSVVPVFGTAIGAAIGGALGAWGGSKVGGWLGRKFDKDTPTSAPTKTQEFNIGGIARGPESGYMAKLHGTEAVVPLPNGKSIPLDMSGFKQSMSEVLGALTKSTPIGMTATAFTKMLSGGNTATGEGSRGASISNMFGSSRSLIDSVGAMAKIIPGPIGMAANAAGKLLGSMPSVSDEGARAAQAVTPSAGLVSKFEEFKATNEDSSKLMQSQLNLLSEIKDILTTSNGLQQQYVYNTYQ